jgi:hypothetical protein
LIGTGAVVVTGVVAYNAWQGAKVRRRMPRPMPAEDVAEPGRTPEDDEPHPFIEPAARREPRESGWGESAAARREPSFGAATAAESSLDVSLTAPLDMPADLQAEDTDGMPLETLEDAAGRAGKADTNTETNAATGAHTDTKPVVSGGGADDEPIVPPVSTISAAPPTVVDRRIDCIVPIRLTGTVAAERVLPLAQRQRRAGSKPVFIEGRPEGGSTWELLQNGGRYDELRAAVLLANRNGALNELEFSEFVTGVQTLADVIDGAPEFPDMMETVAMARELDAFAAQCDAQLSINVLSDGAPWSANYVQAVASQDGLLLSRDGTRFVKLDAKQNPVFMLMFGDTNFLRDDLTYKGGHMITLLLDVPVADEDILPFRLMCDYAKSLAQRIGARVVDDQRRPLPEAALAAIDQQLMTLYAKLEAAGIPAGSPATRRLFSS